MHVFRCYGIQSRAAGSRKTVTGKSGLPELGSLLLSARSPVSPANVLTSPKKGETCEMRVFRYYGTRSRAASSRRNTNRQVGSARASPIAFSPIACQPSLLSTSGRPSKPSSVTAAEERSLETDQKTKTTSQCKLWSEYGNGSTALYING